MLILRMLLSRVLLSIVTLFIVSLIIFSMVELLPGDVVSRMHGRMVTDEQRAIIRAALNLDTPALERYLRWLGQIVRLDFGTTLALNRPINEVLGPKIANTLILAALSFVLYLPMSLIPASIQAIRRDSVVDQGISVVTLILLSTPDFLLATLLLLTFVVFFPLLPAMSIVDHVSTFWEWVRALILPAVTLSLVMSVYAIRFLRDGLIEVLDSDYIRMAELNGLSRRTILWRHALPNALIPTLNVTALNVAYLMGGVVIVEKVVGFPGFGSLTIDAMLMLDVPLIEATVLIAASVYIFANLLADIGAILLNPRLRTMTASK
jgi:peptide/nickel transport system permease protein